MPLIRPARAGDAGQLALIDRLTNSNPRREEQFATNCGVSAEPGRGEQVLVLAIGEDIGGFCLFSQVQDEATLLNIAIHPQRQGEGHGRRLLQGALAQMSRNGAVRCLLEVRQSNAVARALYEGNGFVVDGVRRNYYPKQDGREDALLMSRLL